MKFTDVRFVILFPIACAFYFIFPQKLRKVWLLVLNILFIYSWGVYSATIILSEVILSYFAAFAKDKIADKRIGKAVLIVGFSIILFFFLYCKYFNFVLETYCQITGRDYITKSIIAPIGISFYSLQIIDLCLKLTQD